MARVNIPSRISECNIFVGGLGHLGLVEEMPVPIPKTKKEQQGRLHVDTGLLEPLEVEFTLRDINENLLIEVARLQDAEITAKGSYKQNAVEKGAIVEYKGSIDIDMDNWKSGEGMSVKVKMYPNVYSLEIENKKLIDVDETNMIAKVGGTDLYEKIARNVS